MKNQSSGHLRISFLLLLHYNFSTSNEGMRIFPACFPAQTDALEPADEDTAVSQQFDAFV